MGNASNKQTHKMLRYYNTYMTIKFHQRVVFIPVPSRQLGLIIPSIPTCSMVFLTPRSLAALAPTGLAMILRISRKTTQGERKSQYNGVPIPWLPSNETDLHDTVNFATNLCLHDGQTVEKSLT